MPHLRNYIAKKVDDFLVDLPTNEHGHHDDESAAGPNSSPFELIRVVNSERGTGGSSLSLCHYATLSVHVLNGIFLVCLLFGIPHILPPTFFFKTSFE